MSAKSISLLLVTAQACDAFLSSAPLFSRSRMLVPGQFATSAKDPLTVSQSAFRHNSASVLSGLRMQRGMKTEYDFVVIGGGPVGLTAALAATAVGKSSLIIDGSPKELVQFTGPTGIFSKALRDTAKKVDVQTLRGMGLRDTVVWRQVQDMTLEVLKENGLKNLQDLKYKHIPHMRGNATFLDSDRLSIQAQGSEPVEIKGKNILIATGSTAYRLPHIPYDSTRVFDSDSVKGLSFLPKSLTIIGAGIIAIEYARIFSKLKCQVTIIVRQR